MHIVDTNLSPAEMLALVNFCTGLENFQMVLLRVVSVLKQGSQQLLARSGWARLIMGKYFGVNSVGVLQRCDRLSTRIAIQNASGQPKLGKSTSILKIKALKTYTSYRIGQTSAKPRLLCSEAT